MEYKITSFLQAYNEAVNELISMGVEFRYDPQDKAIYTDLEEDNLKAFEGIQVIVERTEPTQAEVDELNQELYDLLEQTDEQEIELSEYVYARAEQGPFYPNDSVTITEAKIDSVMIDSFSLVFYFGQDYIDAGYFTKADQIKVYQQAIKDTKSYLEDNER